jgi:hypothetical protein
MKKVTKLATAALLTFALMTVFASKANAQQTNNQEATVTQNCTTGAYGTNNCTTTVTQNASNRYVQRVDGTVIPVHSTVNAGIDTTTTMAAIATLLTTGAGAIISYKLKLA